MLYLTVEERGNFHMLSKAEKKTLKHNGYLWILRIVLYRPHTAPTHHTIFSIILDLLFSLLNQDNPYQKNKKA